MLSGSPTGPTGPSELLGTKSSYLLILGEREMKLAQVFPAVVTWQKLTQLKMTPKLAYTLMKYAKLVAVEYEIIEKTRVTLIHELTNTKEDEQAEIKPGTQVFDEYVQRFGSILDVEAALKPCEVKMDDLVAALSIDATNEMTTQDIAILEPFFST